MHAALGDLNPETAVLTLQGGWSGTGTDATRLPGQDVRVRLILSAWSQRQIDGTAVRVGDLRAMIAAKGLPKRPQPGDTLVYQGVAYALVPPVTPLAPTGWPLYYQVNLRETA